MSIWTLGEGGYIKVTFDQSLIGTVADNEQHFTVSWQENEYAPNGPVTVSRSFSPESTGLGESDTNLILTMASTQQFNNAAGLIRVQYDGLGMLRGLGGPVEAFDETFVPVGLIQKPSQKVAEHIEISNITFNGQLMAVDYIDGKAAEHIEISNITFNGALIDVGDL